MRPHLSAHLRALPAVAAAATAVLVLSPATASPLSAQSGPPVVEVSGRAIVSVPSDRATVRLAVTTEAASAGDAVSENADRMSSVVDAVRGLNLPGLDLETEGYDLQPRYEDRPEQRDEPRRIVGYSATNTLSVTFDDVDAVGRVLDAGVEAGANRVAGIMFSASDTEEARTEAVRLAVQRARQEARAMAEALGSTLGPVLEVRGGSDFRNPRPVAMEMAQARTSTPIEAGDQQVSASVTVKFVLGSGGGRP